MSNHQVVSVATQQKAQSTLRSAATCLGPTDTTELSKKGCSSGQCQLLKELPVVCELGWSGSQRVTRSRVHQANADSYLSVWGRGQHKKDGTHMPATQAEG